MKQRSLQDLIPSVKRDGRKGSVGKKPTNINRQFTQNYNPEQVGLVNNKRFREWLRDSDEKLEICKRIIGAKTREY